MRQCPIYNYGNLTVRERERERGGGGRHTGAQT